MKMLIKKDTIHILKFVFKEYFSPFIVQNKVHLSRLNIHGRGRPMSLMFCIFHPFVFFIEFCNKVIDSLKFSSSLDDIDS